MEKSPCSAFMPVVNTIRTPRGHDPITGPPTGEWSTRDSHVALQGLHYGLSPEAIGGALGRTSSDVVRGIRSDIARSSDEMPLEVVKDIYCVDDDTVLTARDRAHSVECSPVPRQPQRLTVSLSTPCAPPRADSTDGVRDSVVINAEYVAREERKCRRREAKLMLHEDEHGYAVRDAFNAVAQCVDVIVHEYVVSSYSTFTALYDGSHTTLAPRARPWKRYDGYLK